MCCLEDDRRGELKVVDGLSFLAACTVGSSGGGGDGLPARLARHFAALAVAPPTTRHLFALVEPLLFGAFPKELLSVAVGDASARLPALTVALWQWLRQACPPSPARPAYAFGLGDLLKAVQGLLLAPVGLFERSLASLAHLWRHECERAWADRLAPADRASFNLVLNDCTSALMAPDPSRQPQKQKEPEPPPVDPKDKKGKRKSMVGAEKKGAPAGGKGAKGKGGKGKKDAEEEPPKEEAPPPEDPALAVLIEPRLFVNFALAPTARPDRRQSMPSRGDGESRGSVRSGFDELSGAGGASVADASVVVGGEGGRQASGFAAPASGGDEFALDIGGETRPPYSDGGSVADVRRAVEQAAAQLQQVCPASDPLAPPECGLVLFNDVVKLVAAMARVLGMPRGSVLLLGLPGAGRRTAVRLAAYLAGQQVAEVPPVPASAGPSSAPAASPLGYTSAEPWPPGATAEEPALWGASPSAKLSAFLAHLKAVWVRCGPGREELTLLVGPGDVADDGVADALNSFLGTGEVDGLMGHAELAHHAAQLRGLAIKEQGAAFVDTPWQLHQFLVGRVRRRLHVAVCLDAPCPALGPTLRRFPALARACAAFELKPWPSEGWAAVAEAALRPVPVSGDRRAKSLLAAYLAEQHLAAREAALRQDRERRRALGEAAGQDAVAVSAAAHFGPESFMGCLATFGKLYQAKRSRLESRALAIRDGLAKVRRDTGLIYIPILLLFHRHLSHSFRNPSAQFFFVNRSNPLLT